MTADDAAFLLLVACFIVIAGVLSMWAVWTYLAIAAFWRRLRVRAWVSKQLDEMARQYP